MKLHVLLGPGGVGKTTLAAGYALALAAHGARVGLLGIDPSRRLQDVLGTPLGDAEKAIAPSLSAAIVHPHQAIARWCADDRLATNPFFVALGDRLATATDVLAAARVAEWLEHDPELTDLVVDTAPGIPALDFVRSPKRLAGMVHGRMVRWLRAASLGRAHFAARRVVSALAGLGGARMVLDLADFFAAVQAPLETMLARVARTQHLLRDGELLLVTSPRDTQAAGALQIRRALAREGLVARTLVVNRTWPDARTAEGDTPFARYVRALLAAQHEVFTITREWSIPTVVVPSQPIGRRAALLSVGESLRRAA